MKPAVWGAAFDAWRKPRPQELIAGDTIGNVALAFNLW